MSSVSIAPVWWIVSVGAIINLVRIKPWTSIVSGVSMAVNVTAVWPARLACVVTTVLIVACARNVRIVGIVPDLSSATLARIVAIVGDARSVSIV